MSKNTSKKPFYSEPACTESCRSVESIILAVETSGRIGSVALGIGSRMLAEKTFATPVKHSAELFPAINELLTNFNKTPDDIEHIYISIGPGSFTGLRLTVTFAKIMHLANDKIKIVAVDSLDVVAANAIDYFQTKPEQDPCSPTLSCLLPRLVSRDAEAGESKSGEIRRGRTIACILDAKRGRFFIAAYRISSVSSTLSTTLKTGSLTTSYKPPEKILEDKLWTPRQFLDEFAVSNKPLLLLGEGLVYYKDLFKSETIDFIDEKYWYPSASKVYSIGRRLAEQGQFSNPLTLTPCYIQLPDTGNC